MLKADGNGNIKCIYCSSESQRLFSPVGIIFKGSGFYVNDYKSSSNASNKADPNSQDKERNKDKEAKDNEKKTGSDAANPKGTGSKGKPDKEKSTKDTINKE